MHHLSKWSRTSSSFSFLMDVKNTKCCLWNTALSDSGGEMTLTLRWQLGRGCSITFHDGVLSKSTRSLRWWWGQRLVDVRQTASCAVVVLPEWGVKFKRGPEGPRVPAAEWERGWKSHRWEWGRGHLRRSNTRSLVEMTSPLSAPLPPREAGGGFFTFQCWHNQPLFIREYFPPAPRHTKSYRACLN